MGISVMYLISDGNCVSSNPPIGGRMINGNAALGDDLFEISVRDANPNVEINRVQDRWFRGMRTFETDQWLNPDIGFAKCIH